LIGAYAQLFRFVEQISPAAAALIKELWPGPLTIVFPARAGLSELLTGGTGTVGVRWTSSSALASILQRIGPLTGTSANRAGEPPLRCADEVQRALGKDIDVIVDAGTTPGGLPSTVIQVQEEVHILREGATARASLEQVLRARGFSLKIE
jgi:L-threonylcarbamoyladenylate synthase